MHQDLRHMPIWLMLMQRWSWRNTKYTVNLRSIWWARVLCEVVTAWLLAAQTSRKSRTAGSNIHVGAARRILYTSAVKFFVLQCRTRNELACRPHSRKPLAICGLYIRASWGSSWIITSLLTHTEEQAIIDRAGLDVASSTISGLIDDDEVQVCCGGDLDGGRRHGLSGHVLLRAAAGDGRRRQLGSGRCPCRRRLRQANPPVSQAALSAAAGSGAVVSDQQLQRWMPTTVIRLARVYINTKQHMQLTSRTCPYYQIHVFN